MLLDQLLKDEKLKWVGTCNELNAGYAADGYARARGVAACVATFTVGGLSIINAIAGSYSEDLPVICITGMGCACAAATPRPLLMGLQINNFQFSFTSSLRVKPTL